MEFASNISDWISKLTQCCFVCGIHTELYYKRTQCCYVYGINLHNVVLCMVHTELYYKRTQCYFVYGIHTELYYKLYTMLFCVWYTH